MKLNGVKPSGKRVEEAFVKYGRDDSEAILFLAEPVTDTEAYKLLCPEPKPPMINRPGKEPTPDLNDKEYKKLLEEHNKLFFHYMTFKSLEATEGLEWEKLDKNDPATWGEIENEWKECGFTQSDINRIYQAVMRANGLDEQAVEAAKQRFLATQQAG